MTRLLTSTMLAALIAVPALVAVPALAQSGITGTSQTVLPSPPVDTMPVQAPLAPQLQSARPAEDWQSAVHEYGDAGTSPLPSEIGRGSAPEGFAGPHNPPFDDKGGGD